MTKSHSNLEPTSANIHRHSWYRHRRVTRLPVRWSIPLRTARRKPRSGWYCRGMTAIDVQQAAEGQKIAIVLDEDQSSAIANGETVQFVIGADFGDDGIEDGRSVVEISLTTKFSD